jgi:hypothetical protein
MNIEVIPSRKGELSHCLRGEDAKVEQVSDFLEVMTNCPTDTFIMHKEDFAEAFFDLRTGLAGEFLQKVSNYRKRLIVLGDYREISSKAFRDFVYESNRTGQVLFTDDLPTAIDLLK